MNRIYERRQQDFGDFNEAHEGDAIVSLVIATGDWLEKLLHDREPIEKAMNALMAALLGDNFEMACEGDDWRERWENLKSNACELQSTQLLTALNAYAFWGLDCDCAFFGVKTADGKRKIDDIARVVGMARTLLDAVPPGWGDCQPIEATVLAAEARLNLDLGSDITIAQLAAIARLSVKSIKNLSTPGRTAAPWTLTSDGKVPWRLAKEWLEMRKEFQSSIWHLHDAHNEVVRDEKQELLSDVVFVPVAKDGTIFDPSACRRADGYTIGKKGAEEHVDDYLTALDRLAKMPIPHWRRPNAIGNWGIVTGVSWQRRTLEDLGLMKKENA
jgi:hypothetical protein